MIWLAAAVAAGIGAWGRLEVELAFRRRGTRRPWGTVVVNLIGALALGLLLGSGAGEAGVRVAGQGLLGGFTTFSTWMVETVFVARRQEGVGAVLANLALPAGAGIALAAAGYGLGRAWL